MRSARLKGYLIFLSAVCVYIFIAAGCGRASSSSRKDFAESLAKICREKYQASVVCTPVNDTIWIYLPYMKGGRSGVAGTKEEKSDLYVEYSIASLNPYRTREPPELKFVVQKTLGNIRQLLLQEADPYKFFVLVVTDITDPAPASKDLVEERFVGYIKDIRDYGVAKDFSGEGYSRLAWDRETVGLVSGEDGQLVLASYRDAKGSHINYYDITMKEFIRRQIKWRIYKRFSIEYNKTPFDATAQEKKEEVLKIIRAVLDAYNFGEFENFYLKDSSFLLEEKGFLGYRQDDIRKYPAKGIRRRPAF
jgi:hypothetical protein